MTCQSNEKLVLNRSFTSWATIFRKALTRPFLIFYQEQIAQLLGVYMAFIYGLFYSTFSLFASPGLRSQYGISLPYRHTGDL